MINIRKINSNNNWRSPLRLANFIIAFAITGVLFLLFSSASPLVGFYGSIEKDQAGRINYVRGANGKAGLQHIECLHKVAEQHTTEMVSYGAIYHTGDNNHDNVLSASEQKVLGDRVSANCGGYWTIIGENVGVGGDSGSIFDAFMNSPKHKANILDGRFAKVGVGAYWGDNGKLWITQVFANCSNCSGGWGTNASLPADPVAPATVTGNVDVANCRRIAGWTYDKASSSTSNEVHIYIDGGGTNLGPTAVYRGDVNSAFGISGNHGFDWTIPDGYRDGKTHTAFIYGINVTGGPNVLIGQRTLDACASPIGMVDGTDCNNIWGWTLDMNDPSASIDVHIYIDSGGYNTGPTTFARGDVNNAYASYGVTGIHGFMFAIPAGWKDGRQHTANSYGINIGNGGNVLLRTTAFGPCY